MNLTDLPLTLAAERQYSASCLSKSQDQGESSTQQMVNIDVGDNIIILEIDEKGWARGKKISVEIDESEQQQAGESADFWFPLESLFPSKLDQFASKSEIGEQLYELNLTRRRRKSEWRMGRKLGHSTLDKFYQEFRKSIMITKDELGSLETKVSEKQEQKSDSQNSINEMTDDSSTESETESENENEIDDNNSEEEEEEDTKSQNSDSTKSIETDQYSKKENDVKISENLLSSNEKHSVFLSNVNEENHWIKVQPSAKTLPRALNTSPLNGSERNSAIFAMSSSKDKVMTKRNHREGNVTSDCHQEKGKNIIDGNDRESTNDNTLEFEVTDKNKHYTKETQNKNDAVESVDENMKIIPPDSASPVLDEENGKKRREEEDNLSDPESHENVSVDDSDSSENDSHSESKDFDKSQEKSVNSSTVTEQATESSGANSNDERAQRMLSLLKSSASFTRSVYTPELRVAIETFNENPREGFEQFKAIPSFNNTPEGIASFFFTTPALAKDMIGEFLGEQASLPILECFIDKFDFRSVDYEAALRRFLSGFKLPGEAQKIDRIMQKFADKYFPTDSDHIFADSSAVYVLSFAVIMLNTDLHNPSIKRKMTFAQFQANVRGINGDESFDKDFLKHLYDSIETDEIKLANSPFPMSIYRGWLQCIDGYKSRKSYWFILDEKDLFGFYQPGAAAIRRKYPLARLQVEAFREERQFFISLCQNRQENEQTSAGDLCAGSEPAPILGKSPRKEKVPQSVQSKMEKKATKPMNLVAADQYLYQKWLCALSNALAANAGPELVEYASKKEKHKLVKQLKKSSSSLKHKEARRESLTPPESSPTLDATGNNSSGVSSDKHKKKATPRPPSRKAFDDSVIFDKKNGTERDSLSPVLVMKQHANTYKDEARNRVNTDGKKDDFSEADSGRRNKHGLNKSSPEMDRQERKRVQRKRVQSRFFNDDI